MLSKRLHTIATLVETKNVYDVGTDHGLLALYLATDHNVVATDISKYAIEKLQKKCINISNLQVIQTNGLENVDIDPNGTIILAGIGSKTIIKILHDKLADNIIADSHGDYEYLRRYMVKIGYYIANEIVIYENHKFYVIIYFKKGIRNYSEMEYIVGVKTINYSNYIKFLLAVYEEAYRNMPNGFRKEKIEKIISYLKGLSWFFVK